MAEPGAGADRERRRLAAALRAQRLTLMEIGRRLGITHQGASHLIQAGKRAMRRGK